MRPDAEDVRPWLLIAVVLAGCGTTDVVYVFGTGDGGGDAAGESASPEAASEDGHALDVAVDASGDVEASVESGSDAVDVSAVDDAADAASEVVSDAGLGTDATVCGLTVCNVYALTQGPYASMACLNPPFNTDEYYAVCPTTCTPPAGWAQYTTVNGQPMYCVPHL